MSVSDIEHDGPFCIATCSKCGTRISIEAASKAKAAPRFRAMGWTISSVPGADVCPTCRERRRKEAQRRAVERLRARVKPVELHPHRDEREEEMARIRAEQKKRHDEMFGLTGEWER